MIALAALGAVAVAVAGYEVAALTTHRLPTICQHVRANPPAQHVVRHLCAEHHH